jgi:serine/threonine-protein kinase
MSNTPPGNGNGDNGNGTGSGGGNPGGADSGMNIPSGSDGGMNIPSGSDGGMNIPSGSDGGMNVPSGTLFPASSVYYQDITNAPKDSESDQVIAAIQSKGGWGNGNNFSIDFSIDVLTGDSATPMMTFMPTADFYSPDCDNVMMPVPAAGAVEGETGYSCTMGGDCHLIVVEKTLGKLYEMWRADITGGVFNGGCLAVWDLTRDYAPHGRGEGCTSADAGGFPITAMLFTADEVAAGHIDHAIRFILPNDRIRKGVYVHPATHSTFASASTTPALAAPYGARFRLRPDYPIANLSTGGQVVAKALMKYGMILSDGGQVPLTAANDQFTTAKWSGLLGASDIAAIQVGDFVMVDGGARIPYTQNTDCTRVP